MKTFILATLIAVALAASTSSMARAGGFVSQSQTSGYQSQFGGYQYQGKIHKYNLGGGIVGPFQNTQQGSWQNRGQWQGQQTQQQGQQVPRQGGWAAPGCGLPAATR